MKTFIILLIINVCVCMQSHIIHYENISMIEVRIRSDYYTRANVVLLEGHHNSYQINPRSLIYSNNCEEIIDLDAYDNSDNYKLYPFCTRIHQCCMTNHYTLSKYYKYTLFINDSISCTITTG